MLPELGLFSLIIALQLAILQGTLPLVGSLFQYEIWIKLSKPLAYGQSLFIILSFCALMISFINNDFSVTYVAENSNHLLPLFYRMAGVWGAHEGSLLLWITALALWTMAVARFSEQLPAAFLALILAVLAWVSLGFIIFLLFYSNPFARLLPNVPVDGNDLNPLLQDPGLATHPPMLYMGYVGFSVAFAFAIAALISGKLDRAWARWTQPWTVLAWMFLTGGITLGSWWAYRVLGWGGWWFWDPVENASFLPWLTGTALIHSLMVAAKRDTFKSWTVLLAIGAFSLSLMGTFIVRSGILTSVHAFAVDPARGAYILKFLMIIIGGSLLLYAVRSRKVMGHPHFNLLSRETFLLVNNVILVVVMITILLGTLYPLIMEALHLGKLSVGAPYFNALFVPLMLPLLVVMGLGPQCYWQAMNLSLFLRRIVPILLLSILLGLLLWLFLPVRIHGVVLLSTILSLWMIMHTVQVFGRACVERGISAAPYGFLCAHVGFGICALGIIFAATHSQQLALYMHPGEQVTFGKYVFAFNQIDPIRGPNWQGMQADFTVSENERVIAQLYPQQRLYPSSQTAISRVDTDVGLWRDLYLALGDKQQNDQWAIRLYHKPLVRFIWVGGLLMLVGGFLAVMQRKKL